MHEREREREALTEPIFNECLKASLHQKRFKVKPKVASVHQSKSESHFVQMSFQSLKSLIFRKGDDFVGKTEEVGTRGPGAWLWT